MTEKRFENRLDKSNVKFNTLNPVWDNEKETGLNVFEMIDELNNLSEEKEKLQFELKECSDNKLFSRRGLEKENEQLKFELNKLSRENKRFEIFIQRLGDIAEENGALSKCRVKAEIQYFGEQC